MRLTSILVLVGSLLSTPLFAFYLPGVAPREFEDGEAVKLKVNKLDSTKTQIPFDYYDLPFCRPENINRDAENLGEVLTGERIENSAYEIKMRMSRTCALLCRKVYNPKEISQFREKILEEYKVNYIVDNLPAATRIPLTASNGKTQDEIFIKGFILGRVQRENKFTKSSQGGPTVFLNNHVDLKLMYHEDASYDGHRIVGFEVAGRSIKHENVDKLNCGATRWLELNTGLKQLEVFWTYSVVWQSSEIKWASRWDPYLKMQDPQIHWFSIMNSFMIVLFLTGMVAMILARALHKDFRRYNQDDPEMLEMAQEETGWKLVHGDVFRPPACPSLFASLVGTGIQVFAMAMLTLVFAALGFLSPANRGALMTTLLLLFVFMGVFAGYYSARAYKAFGEHDWKKNTLLTAFLFPGMCFLIFFVLNCFIAGEKSSGAVPFGTMFAILILWFGISVPLVFLGAWFGYRKDPVELPCKVNQLRREVPDQPWYMQQHFSVLVGGVLPFGAVFIEVFFIMSSIWLHRFYYMFGFLFIVFLILIITSAEITIVMCYFQLCSEDYNWWWRSYFTAGSSALYLFFYSILYFFTKLDITPFISGLLYFGYMTLVSLAFFVITGTIGHIATFAFVRIIYGSIKIE